MKCLHNFVHSSDSNFFLIDSLEEHMHVDEIANVGCRFEREGRKPTLYELQRWHHVASPLLAQVAGFDDADIVHQIWIGRRGRFTVSSVIRVLQALDELVEVAYLLDDVYIQFREDAQAW
jgi:hypothetical protein